ncbi:MAG: homoserine O-acetyltransferase [Phycisphaerae bacterium]|nr:homoserine O-acetyltransferase [Phycisphaerae bacterium]
MGNSDSGFLNSSDSVRSGAPLKHAQTVTFEEPLELERGGVLPRTTVVFETYGQLNERRDNAVLICHAISGDSHVARHDEQDGPGWWDLAGVVGPGRPIDTDRLFVICPNILGGCRGTTGPGSINPATGRPYGADFPTITTGDMVAHQKRLIGHLGIGRLRAVVGGSMGGHQVLAWAIRYPDQVAGAIALATSARLTSQALAFDVVGRNAILHDPHFRDGRYGEESTRPAVGLAIARMIGHITYLSPQAMQEKFDLDRLQPRDVATEFEKEFSVGSYLGYQGSKFVERFDANSYITLSMAMDLFDLGHSRSQLAEALAPSQCRWLVVSFTSDWLFPPSQSEDIVAALLATNKSVSYCNVTSACGHDAFLVPDDVDRYGELVRAFLANLGGAPLGTNSEAPAGPRPTSIFQPQRLDYDRIVELIPPHTSVLDLGCAEGQLLTMLTARGHERLVGVELDEQAVIASVQRGVDVIQADLNKGLATFRDREFDFVVLSLTLQAVRDVEGVVRELLRVGRRCIVSFPNFAYYKLRKVLAEQGRAPESPGQLHHKWYDSPNIRFCSIADFQQFCADRGITVHRQIALDTEAGTEVRQDPNYYADLAIFVISR